MFLRSSQEVNRSNELPMIWSQVTTSRNRAKPICNETSAIFYCMIRPNANIVKKSLMIEVTQQKYLLKPSLILSFSIKSTLIEIMSSKEHLLH